MKITKTPFEGLALLEPNAFKDERGFFMEVYTEQTMAKLGINTRFVQDNQSFSKKNVIRGLHYQNPPYAQVKLVRVLSGKILDVVVDIRSAQPTFRKAYAVELSADDRRQLYIPAGFAHGFLVLSESAEVLYKTDNYYHPESEGGVLYNDPEWEINWGIAANDAIVSAKDLVLPLAKDLKSQF